MMDVSIEKIEIRIRGLIQINEYPDFTASKKLDNSWKDGLEEVLR